MMFGRNFKVWLCLACMATSMAAPAPQQVYPLALDIIDMAAISRMSPQQLEKLAEGLAAEEIMRTKRSSAQALTSAVSKASSGIQSKVGLLGQASAFISSASSKGGHDEHGGYSYEPHQQAEKYDYWGLKKSILYTLFQAVKAITGGVTILKGQLIKGGGALASTLGKVIAGKGDVVSNIGKKIVSSAALSEKKPHGTPVYGPPPPSHVEYGPPPSAYGAPTAPAHYSHSAPALPTGYAAHKYPAQFDGRSKLNGVHAGLVILTPLGEQAASETVETGHTDHAGHTPLEPPQSIIHSVYSAIKNAFTPTSAPADEGLLNQPPPPPQPMPPFAPMSWAVNSYGEPAAPDAYTDYNPRNPTPAFDYPPAKRAVVTQKQGLTAQKIKKINFNLNKIASHMSQRSLDAVAKFNPDALSNDTFLPTPVVSDNEIGVLPAELLPSDDPPISTTPTTTVSPSESSRRKDVKYFLRGNKIVLV